MSAKTIDEHSNQNTEASAHGLDAGIMHPRMARRRKILQQFYSDRAYDKKGADREPMPGIGQREGEADDQVGHRPVDIDRCDRMGTKADWRDRYENDGGEEKPGNRLGKFVCCHKTHNIDASGGFTARLRYLGGTARAPVVFPRRVLPACYRTVVVENGLLSRDCLWHSVGRNNKGLRP